MSVVGESVGWQDKTKADTRSYVCRYSYDGGPCASRETENFPSGLHCPPSCCCSKTHMLNGQSGMWCTPSWALCNGVLNYSNYSYGGCSCVSYNYLCHANATCKEEEKPLGGAYCICRDGYKGDGIICKEDKCITKGGDTSCYPGKCVFIQETGEVNCQCPDYYEQDSTTDPPSCKVINACINNPCGDAQAVKQCYHEGPGRYSCLCNKGYIAVNKGDTSSSSSSSSNTVCDDIFNHLMCANNPCGVEGVSKCIDKSEGGVTCMCLSGYTLVKETLQYRCVRQDPCLLNPCGDTTAAASCVATSTSYTCTCKDGYVSVQDTQGPYCALDTNNNTQYILFASVGAAALLLFLFVFYLSRRRRVTDLDDAEVEFLNQDPAAIAAAAGQGGRGGYSDTAYFSPNGWA